MPPIILASASPRRSQLLRDLGVPFQVVPSSAVEPPPTPEETRNPAAYVQTLAHLKAQSSENEAIILAADTVVYAQIDGCNQILGKPENESEARAMLQALRGQTHQVFTGVCVRRGAEFRLAHQVTRVTFGDFSDDFVSAYVATGEPMDKAGAYAAQGKGALLIEKIEGDYHNVVGLPLQILGQMLREFGVEIEAFWRA